MKFRPIKQAPVLIAVGVIALVCVARFLDFDFFDRLERMTYDWRARFALRFPQPVATNLGAVFMSDDSVAALNNGSLGFRYGLYWPRHIYGRTLRELSAQGATAVAFDVLFREARPDHTPVPVANAKYPEITEFLRSLHPSQEPATFDNDGEKLTLVESDDYFAWQLKRSGRAIVAADEGVLPLPLLASNAWMRGDISADRDGDGVLRRAAAFRMYRRWHPAFRQAEADPLFGVDLSKARIEPGKIILRRTNGEKIEIPVGGDNNFELAAFGGDQLPPGTPLKAKAFIEERVWHMGIVLAARELRLDLSAAHVDLEHGQIAFQSDTGVQRILPVDEHGYFYINWELMTNDPRLAQGPIEALLEQDLARADSQTAGLSDAWRNKLVVVGSSATGNDLTDRGATPLEKDTFLVSKHWNVANSLITGRFVRSTPLASELALIALLGILTAFLTWQLRVFLAASGVLLLALVYCLTALFLYVQYRYWIPLVLPIFGVMLVEHVSLVTYRVVFEQSERRRVKSVFSKIVSPNVVNELLEAETLALGGARREVTVMFADVRGFTELTDTSHERAVAYVQEHQLTGDAAEICFDESARETLNTVNLYLARVADNVKQHTGTLDKYIGDCVMAFWGAPTPNPKHALACVRAAVDAQRAIHVLNQQRAAQNEQLESENLARVSAGLPPKPLHAMLVLGTGINSGPVTVGLMGSDAHILNYTVFGREVNLASRLESVSGRARIVISEGTFRHLQLDDPALAATCIELPPASVKGFRTAVKNYEVPWRLPAASAGTAASMTDPK